MDMTVTAVTGVAMGVVTGVEAGLRRDVCSTNPNTDTVLYSHHISSKYSLSISPPPLSPPPPQVREPLHPLLGAMNRTNVMMEVSANQGYTGHAIHVVNFAQQWKVRV